MIAAMITTAYVFLGIYIAGFLSVLIISATDRTTPATALVLAISWPIIVIYGMIHR
jgi:hypothetical protein